MKNFTEANDTCRGLRPKLYGEQIDGVRLVDTLSNSWPYLKSVPNGLYWAAFRKEMNMISSMYNDYLREDWADAVGEPNGGVDCMAITQKLGQFSSSPKPHKTGCHENHFRICRIKKESCKFRGKSVYPNCLFERLYRQSQIPEYLWSWW